jgi:hypothetical protein
MSFPLKRPGGSRAAVPPYRAAAALLAACLLAALAPTSAAEPIAMGEACNTPFADQADYDQYRTFWDMDTLYGNMKLMPITALLTFDEACSPAVHQPDSYYMYMTTQVFEGETLTLYPGIPSYDQSHRFPNGLISLDCMSNTTSAPKVKWGHLLRIIEDYPVGLHSECMFRRLGRTIAAKYNWAPPSDCEADFYALLYLRLASDTNSILRLAEHDPSYITLMFSRLDIIVPDRPPWSPGESTFIAQAAECAANAYYKERKFKYLQDMEREVQLITERVDSDTMFGPFDRWWTRFKRTVHKINSDWCADVLPSVTSYTWIEHYYEVTDSGTATRYITPDARPDGTCNPTAADLPDVTYGYDPANLQVPFASDAEWAFYAQELITLTNTHIITPDMKRDIFESDLKSPVAHVLYRLSVMMADAYGWGIQSTDVMLSTALHGLQVASSVVVEIVPQRLMSVIPRVPYYISNYKTWSYLAYVYLRTDMIESIPLPAVRYENDTYVREIGGAQCDKPFDNAIDYTNAIIDLDMTTLLWSTLLSRKPCKPHALTRYDHMMRLYDGGRPEFHVRNIECFMRRVGATAHAKLGWPITVNDEGGLDFIGYVALMEAVNRNRYIPITTAVMLFNSVFDNTIERETGPWSGTSNALDYRCRFGIRMAVAIVDDCHTPFNAKSYETYQDVMDFIMTTKGFDFALNERNTVDMDEYMTPSTNDYSAQCFFEKFGRTINERGGFIATTSYQFEFLGIMFWKYRSTRGTHSQLEDDFHIKTSFDWWMAQIEPAGDEYSFDKYLESFKRRTSEIHSAVEFYSITRDKLSRAHGAPLGNVLVSRAHWRSTSCSTPIGNTGIARDYWHIFELDMWTTIEQMALGNLCETPEGSWARLIDSDIARASGILCLSHRLTNTVRNDRYKKYRQDVMLRPYALFEFAHYTASRGGHGWPTPDYYTHNLMRTSSPTTAVKAALCSTMQYGGVDTDYAFNMSLPFPNNLRYKRVHMYGEYPSDEQVRQVVDNFKYIERLSTIYLYEVAFQQNIVRTVFFGIGKSVAETLGLRLRKFSYYTEFLGFMFTRTSFYPNTDNLVDVIDYAQPPSMTVFDPYPERTILTPDARLFASMYKLREDEFSVNSKFTAERIRIDVINSYEAWDCYNHLSTNQREVFYIPTSAEQLEGELSRSRGRLDIMLQRGYSFNVCPQMGDIDLHSFLRGIGVTILRELRKPIDYDCASIYVGIAAIDKRSNWDTGEERESIVKHATDYWDILNTWADMQCDINRMSFDIKGPLHLLPDRVARENIKAEVSEMAFMPMRFDVEHSKQATGPHKLVKDALYECGGAFVGAPLKVIANMVASCGTEVDAILEQYEMQSLESLGVHYPGKLFRAALDCSNGASAIPLLNELVQACIEQPRSSTIQGEFGLSHLVWVREMLALSYVSPIGGVRTPQFNWLWPSIGGFDVFRSYFLNELRVFGYICELLSYEKPDMSDYRHKVEEYNSLVRKISSVHHYPPYWPVGDQITDASTLAAVDRLVTYCGAGVGHMPYYVSMAITGEMRVLTYKDVAELRDERVIESIARVCRNRRNRVSHVEYVTHSELIDMTSGIVGAGWGGLLEEDTCSGRKKLAMRFLIDSYGKCSDTWEPGTGICEGIEPPRSELIPHILLGNEFTFEGQTTGEWYDSVIELPTITSWSARESQLITGSEVRAYLIAKIDQHGQDHVNRVICAHAQIAQSSMPSAAELLGDWSSGMCTMLEFVVGNAIGIGKFDDELNLCDSPLGVDGICQVVPTEVGAGQLSGARASFVADYAVTTPHKLSKSTWYTVCGALSMLATEPGEYYIPGHGTSDGTGESFIGAFNYNDLDGIRYVLEGKGREEWPPAQGMRTSNDLSDRKFAFISMLHWIEEALKYTPWLWNEVSGWDRMTYDQLNEALGPDSYIMRNAYLIVHKELLGYEPASGRACPEVHKMYDAVINGISEYDELVRIEELALNMDVSDAENVQCSESLGPPLAFTMTHGLGSRVMIERLAWFSTSTSVHWMPWEISDNQVRTKLDLLQLELYAMMTPGEEQPLQSDRDLQKRLRKLARMYEMQITPYNLACAVLLPGESVDSVTCESHGARFEQLYGMRLTGRAPGGTVTCAPGGDVHDGDEHLSVPSLELAGTCENIPDPEESSNSIARLVLNGGCKGLTKVYDDKPTVYPVPVKYLYHPEYQTLKESYGLYAGIDGDAPPPFDDMDMTSCVQRKVPASYVCSYLEPFSMLGGNVGCYEANYIYNRATSKTRKVCSPVQPTTIDGLWYAERLLGYETGSLKSCEGFEAFCIAGEAMDAQGFRDYEVTPTDAATGRIHPRHLMWLHSIGIDLRLRQMPWWDLQDGKDDKDVTDTMEQIGTPNGRTPSDFIPPYNPNPTTAAMVVALKMTPIFRPSLADVSGTCIILSLHNDLSALDDINGIWGKLMSQKIEVQQTTPSDLGCNADGQWAAFDPTPEEKEVLAVKLDTLRQYGYGRLLYHLETTGRLLPFGITSEFFDLAEWKDYRERVTTGNELYELGKYDEFNAYVVENPASCIGHEYSITRDTATITRDGVRKVLDAVGTDLIAYAASMWTEFKPSGCYRSMLAHPVQCSNAIDFVDFMFATKNSPLNKADCMKTAVCGKSFLANELVVGEDIQSALDVIWGATDEAWAVPPTDDQPGSALKLIVQPYEPEYWNRLVGSVATSSVSMCYVSRVASTFAAHLTTEGVELGRQYKLYEDPLHANDIKGQIATYVAFSIVKRFQTSMKEGLLAYFNENDCANEYEAQGLVANIIGADRIQSEPSMPLKDHCQQVHWWRMINNDPCDDFIPDMSMGYQLDLLNMDTSARRAAVMAAVNKQIADFYRAYYYMGDIETGPHKKFMAEAQEYGDGFYQLVIKCNAQEDDDACSKITKLIELAGGQGPYNARPSGFTDDITTLDKIMLYSSIPHLERCLLASYMGAVIYQPPPTDATGFGFQVSVPNADAVHQICFDVGGQNNHVLRNKPDQGGTTPLITSSFDMTEFGAFVERTFEIAKEITKSVYPDFTGEISSGKTIVLSEWNMLDQTFVTEGKYDTLPVSCEGVELVDTDTSTNVDFESATVTEEILNFVKALEQFAPIDAISKAQARGILMSLAPSGEINYRRLSEVTTQSTCDDASVPYATVAELIAARVYFMIGGTVDDVFQGTWDEQLIYAYLSKADHLVNVYPEDESLVYARCVLRRIGRTWLEITGADVDPECASSIAWAGYTTKIQDINKVDILYDIAATEDTSVAPKELNAIHQPALFGDMDVIAAKVAASCPSLVAQRDAILAAAPACDATKVFENQGDLAGAYIALQANDDDEASRVALAEAFEAAGVGQMAAWAGNNELEATRAGAKQARDGVIAAIGGDAGCVMERAARTWIAEFGYTHDEECAREVAWGPMARMLVTARLRDMIAQVSSKEPLDGYGDSASYHEGVWKDVWSACGVDIAMRDAGRIERRKELEPYVCNTQAQFATIMEAADARIVVGDGTGVDAELKACVNERMAATWAALSHYPDEMCAVDIVVERYADGPVPQSVWDYAGVDRVDQLTETPTDPVFAALGFDHFADTAPESATWVAVQTECGVDLTAACDAPFADAAEFGEYAELWTDSSKLEKLVTGVGLVDDAEVKCFVTRLGYTVTISTGRRLTVAENDDVALKTGYALLHQTTMDATAMKTYVTDFEVATTMPADGLDMTGEAEWDAVLGTTGVSLSGEIVKVTLDVNCDIPFTSDGELQAFRNALDIGDLAGDFTPTDVLLVTLLSENPWRENLEWSSRIVSVGTYGIPAEEVVGRYDTSLSMKTLRTNTGLHTSAKLLGDAHFGCYLERLGASVLTKYGKYPGCADDAQEVRLYAGLEHARKHMFDAEVDHVASAINRRARLPDLWSMAAILPETVQYPASMVQRTAYEIKAESFCQVKEGNCPDDACSHQGRFDQWRICPNMYCDAELQPTISSGNTDCATPFADGEALEVWQAAWRNNFDSLQTEARVAQEQRILDAFATTEAGVTRASSVLDHGADWFDQLFPQDESHSTSGDFACFLSRIGHTAAVAMHREAPTTDCEAVKLGTYAVRTVMDKEGVSGSFEMVMDDVKGAWFFRDHSIPVEVNPTWENAYFATDKFADPATSAVARVRLAKGLCWVDGEVPSDCSCALPLELPTSSVIPETWQATDSSGSAVADTTMDCTHVYEKDELSAAAGTTGSLRTVLDFDNQKMAWKGFVTSKAGTLATKWRDDAAMYYDNIIMKDKQAGNANCFVSQLGYTAAANSGRNAPANACEAIKLGYVAFQAMIVDSGVDATSELDVGTVLRNGADVLEHAVVPEGDDRIDVDLLGRDKFYDGMQNKDRFRLAQELCWTGGNVPSNCECALPIELPQSSVIPETWQATDSSGNAVVGTTTDCTRVYLLNDLQNELRDGAGTSGELRSVLNLEALAQWGSFTSSKAETLGGKLRDDAAMYYDKYITAAEIGSEQAGEANCFVSQLGYTAAANSRRSAPANACEAIKFGYAALQAMIVDSGVTAGSSLDIVTVLRNGADVLKTPVVPEASETDIIDVKLLGRDKFVDGMQNEDRFRLAQELCWTGGNVPPNCECDYPLSDNMVSGKACDMAFGSVDEFNVYDWSAFDGVFDDMVEMCFLARFGRTVAAANSWSIASECQAQKVGYAALMQSPRGDVDAWKAALADYALASATYPEGMVVDDTWGVATNLACGYPLGSVPEVEGGWSVPMIAEGVTDGSCATPFASASAIDTYWSGSGMKTKMVKESTFGNLARAFYSPSDRSPSKSAVVKGSDAGYFDRLLFSTFVLGSTNCFVSRLALTAGPYLTNIDLSAATPCQIIKVGNTLINQIAAKTGKLLTKSYGVYYFFNSNTDEFAKPRTLELDSFGAGVDEQLMGGALFDSVASDEERLELAKGLCWYDGEVPYDCQCDYPMHVVPDEMVPGKACDKAFGSVDEFNAYGDAWAAYADVEAAFAAGDDTTRCFAQRVGRTATAETDTCIATKVGYARIMQVPAGRADAGLQPMDNAAWIGHLGDYDVIVGLAYSSGMDGGDAAWAAASGTAACDYPDGAIKVSDRFINAAQRLHVQRVLLLPPTERHQPDASRRNDSIAHCAPPLGVPRCRRAPTRRAGRCNMRPRSSTNHRERCERLAEFDRCARFGKDNSIGECGGRMWQVSTCQSTRL